MILRKNKALGTKVLYKYAFNIYFNDSYDTVSMLLYLMTIEYVQIFSYMTQTYSLFKRSRYLEYVL